MYKLTENDGNRLLDIISERNKLRDILKQLNRQRDEVIAKIEGIDTEISEIIRRAK